MRRRQHLFPLIVAVTILSLSTDTTRAQKASEAHRVQRQIDPATLDIMMDGPAPVDEANAGEANADQQAQRQAQQLLQQYLQVQYIRQPGAALSAMVQQAGGEKPAPMPSPMLQNADEMQGVRGMMNQRKNGEQDASDADQPAQQFQWRVTAGDWRAVAADLAAMPENTGLRVYEHILRMLTAQQATLTPKDVLALADSAPGDLAQRHLQMLSALLGRAMTLAGQPRQLLAELQAADTRLNRDDPKRRRTIVCLLLAGNLVEPAGAYLPDLQQALTDQNAAAVNLHADYQQAVSTQKNDPMALGEAWRLSQRVLTYDDPHADLAQRRFAQQRLMGLLNQAPDELGSKWLSEVFTQTPALGLELLASAALPLDQRPQPPHMPMRAEHLKTLHRLAMELIGAVDDEIADWRPALEQLALAWLREATMAAMGAGSPKDFDPEIMSGPSINSQQRMMMQQMQRRQNNGRPQIDPSVLLSSAPQEDWLALIHPDLVHQIRLLSAQLASQAGELDLAFSMIVQLSSTDAQAASQLTAGYIHAWIIQLSQRAALGGEGPYPQQMIYSGGLSSSGYYPGGPRPNQSGAVPLTRAMQQRQLIRLRALVDQLSILPFDDWREQPLVSAFSACHSAAEVYRFDDIHAIFGAGDQIQTQTAVQLIDHMRRKLAQQWRSAQVQNQAGSKRTDKETAAEVDRGYAVALSLIDQAISQTPDDWRLHLTRANLHYDKAEFLYGQKVDLPTYTTLRDAAFTGYRQSAALYQQAAHVSGDQAPQDVRVLLQWFQSALGASDLAYLTRQDTPDLDQIAQIKAVIDGMAPEIADLHRKLFAESLIASMNQAPAQLKPRYIRHGLRIVGDHPAAKPAHELLAFYDDLLNELELALSIDGSSTINAAEPFGVRLGLRHTTTLGREAGGFGKYLNERYYMPQTGASVDMREQIEQSVRESLQESFEIDAVHFHQPDVRPHGFGHPGWLETPLAYLVMRVKDISVDRIPTTSMDMDFNDGQGVVVLPVESAVVLIDATSDTTTARPNSEVQITQLLDDRSLDQGVLRLEVRATAKGLTPAMPQLLDFNGQTIGAFSVAAMHDHGLNVVGLDQETEESTIESERSWLIELTAPKTGRAEAFTFPSAVDDSYAMSYQRYADADLVEVEQIVALKPVDLTDWLGWSAAIVGLAFALLATAWWVIKRRLGAASAQEAPRYHRPQRLTPFTAVTLLRRMEQDPQLALSAAQREQLADQLGDLERFYFTRESNAPGTPGASNDRELGPMVDRWLGAAGVTPV